MFFNILIVILTIVILFFLIGLYYFSKQKYDNFFVSLLLDTDKLRSLKANKINEKKYRKINFILRIQTIFLIGLSTSAIYIFKFGSHYINYIIIVLLVLVKFISNKFIEQTFNKKEI